MVVEGVRFVPVGEGTEVLMGERRLISNLHVSVSIHFLNWHVVEGIVLALVRVGISEVEEASRALSLS